MRLAAWLRRRIPEDGALAGAETRRVLRRSRRLWLAVGPWRQRTMVWVGAVAVAAAAIAFAVGSERANDFFLQAVHHAWWIPFLVTPVGLACVVALTRGLFPGSQGSGIPQTIAALSLREGASVRQLLGPRIALGKMMLTLAALASGASVGREGPTVQVGASIMHGIGNLAGVGGQMQRHLILAGGAAGVAAAFNTPLAGIVFAIEEMSRAFESRASATILTAVIFAGIASLAVLGNYTYFGHASASLPWGDGWIAVLLCGVVGGLAGGLFARLLIAVTRGLGGGVGSLARARPVTFAFLCGLVLALIGLASGGTTYGTGYHEARALLEGQQLPHAYAPLKMVATLVSYASGVPGGIFAPSLAAGAGIGSLVAEFAPYAPTAAVILLGMVAYFAGVVQAPITAFVIVIELTDSHEMALPLMAAALVGHGASRLVCRRSLYRTLADDFLARLHAGRPDSASVPAREPMP